MRAERINDAAGRVVRYIERNESNSVRTDVTRTWDADGLQTLETDNQTGRTTTYSYLGDGTLDKVVSEGGGSAKTTTSYTYEWWDSAKQKEVKVQGDNGQSGWAPGFSRFTYDVNGNVKSATDVVGKREFRYLVDGDGQVLRRDEYLGSETNASGELVSARGNRSHSYYYLGGHRVGNVGNDGVERVDYAQELSRVTPEQTKAEDYYKRFKPSAGADFDENYMPINSGYPGSAPGAYTVRTGETLRSIATSLWGDAALWWVLADANGLSGDDALIAGTVLRVPNKVTNVHNTSETYRPYDPGKALGNTSPTLPEPPPPPGRGGCGGLGQVLAVVVAVVATIYTAGVAAPAFAGTAAAGSFSATMAAGASALAGAAGTAGLAAAVVGGAVGAVAGQVAAIATGVQDKFSWTGVALGAVGAGVTAGLGQATGLTAALSSALESKVAVQAALGGIRSATAQGIGVITGLQSNFDWKGVAASAIASGVAYQVGQTELGKAVGIGRVAQAISAGVTSAAVRGESLGRNLAAIVTDSVAGTVGNAIAERLAQPSDMYAALSTSMAQAKPIPMEMGVQVAGPIPFGGTLPEITVTANAIDEWAPYVGGTVMGVGQAAIEALRFANDQVLTVANFASAGSLAANNSAVAEAVSRNAALGQGLLKAPGAIARTALRVATGNLSGEEIISGARSTLALDEVEQLHAAGRTMEAQALLTKKAIGLVSLAAGGAGGLAGTAGTVSSMGRAAGVGARLAVEDFAASSVGQRVGRQLETLNERIGGMAYAVPEGSGVWGSVPTAVELGKRPNFFTTEISWVAPARGTGLQYKVYQQEIDWSLEVNGVANMQRAQAGQAPFVMKNGEMQQLQLHHSRQNGEGPLFELSRATHLETRAGHGREALHPYGRQQHPDLPVNRPIFNKDVAQYWRDRAAGAQR